ncbi:phage tail protein [Pseudomonas nunensis]|uniref:phage tail protein n=1 Tax=Pseudomonas nunensis TaxID=2961896 RepID=UPI0025B1D312|nr:phage tail protein [Pseudomonas nunensis]MDN3220335.1 phage tail protein [Pseudomonas nunensis]
MADYYTLLTNAGIAYETACKAAGLPIKLSQLSVGDGGGAVYNPAATDTALRREVWRGPLNALFQDEKNPSWLLAEVTIPPEVGGWYVREAGIWTDTGILYAIVKYPESFKPVLATSGSGKEFYIRSIFETSNASLVTLLIDDTVVKATRAWVTSYVADELAKLDSKQSVRVATTANITLAGPQTVDGVAVVAGDRVLVKNQTVAKDNGIYVAAVAVWVRSKDADVSADVTSGLIVSVEQGTTLADTRWQLITDGAIVLGTTALTFQNVTQGFAPLNAPALVSPTANTPLQFDDSTRLATTEFVRRAQGNYRGFTSLTTSTILPASAFGTVVTVIGTFTLTLPAASVPTAGHAINFRNIGGGVVTVVCAGNDSINSGAGQITGIALIPGANLELVSNGSASWWASGSAQLQYAQVLGSTPPQFDNGKALATTEFVQRAQGNFASRVDILALPATLSVSSAGSRIVINATGTLTLPPVSSVPTGTNFYIYNAFPGVITIVRQGTDFISSFANGSLTSVTLQAASNIVITAGNTQWVVEGGMSSLKYSSEFASSVSGNIGYQKLPGGDVEQWGLYVAAPSGSDTVIPLPVAMLAAPTNIQVSFADFSSSLPVGIAPVLQARNSTLGTITVRNLYGTNASFFWRVRGKA